MNNNAWKHGMIDTPTYKSWKHIIERCTNPNAVQYKDYGGRGITVCDEWTDFLNFYRDVGDRPNGMTLDRIDNDKGYSKDNCRWAAREEQSNNKRNSRFIEFDGMKKTFAQWSRHFGIEYYVIYQRARDGWSAHDIFFTPSKLGRNSH